MSEQTVRRLSGRIGHVETRSRPPKGLTCRRYQTVRTSAKPRDPVVLRHERGGFEHRGCGNQPIRRVSRKQQRELRRFDNNGWCEREKVDSRKAIDEELLLAMRATIDEAGRQALQKLAEEELAGFRASTNDADYHRAREAAINHLVRDQFGLPSLTM